MMTPRIDFNLFQVFIIIYDEGNLTRASEVLHLTQPAISHSLSRLREAFGDPLFVRRGTRMEPTPKARSMVDQVRRSITELRQTLEPNERYDYANSRRTFRLALRDITEAACLPDLMQVVESKAPNIRIISQRVERKRIESLLTSGKLDLAMDVFLPFGDQIHHKLFRQDRFVVVARKGHPAMKEGLGLNAYLAAQHILVSTRSEGLGLEDANFAKQGHTRKIALRSQHFFIACHTVQHTDYLVTMPESYAQVVNRGLATETHPLPIPVPQIDVFLYWHQQAENDPANRWLRDQLTALPAGISR